MNKAIMLSAVLICVILTASFGAVFTLTDENQSLKEKIINQKLTLVFHVSEKGEEYRYARLPNANLTYQELLKLNNDTHDILLLPEYKANVNWTEESVWLQNNFGGIPIMLDVFGGGSGNTPTPMLTIEQIQEAFRISNVKYIRFSEVVSWHIENKQAFPINYVQEVLEHCKKSNVKVFWTEWKNDFPEKNIETFNAIKTYIQGYEDIVTVSFSTNSQDLEPADGFLKMDQMFPHWGASIQPWYWNTTRNQDLMDMPASLILEHSFMAKGLGAEVIQFEPYWYFFEWSGVPNDNLKLILTHLR